MAIKVGSGYRLCKVRHPEYEAESALLHHIAACNILMWLDEAKERSCLLEVPNELHLMKFARSMHACICAVRKM